MIIMSGGIKVNVASKTKVNEMLKSYKGIITPEVYEYLQGLIELEYSAFSGKISDKVTSKLTELDMYRQIAVYNIYNQTRNLLLKETENKELVIGGNERGFEGLQANMVVDGKEYRILDYKYLSEARKEKQSKFSGPVSKKIFSVGTVNLYLTEVDEINRLKTLENYRESLKFELQKKNPYSSTRLERIDSRDIDRYSHVEQRSRIGGSGLDWYAEVPVYGGPASTWANEHHNKIESLEKSIAEYEARSVTETDKKVIEMKKYYYDLLLSLYDIKPEDFTEEKEKNSLRKDSSMNKTLVKKYPGMQIKTNISKM